MRREGDRGTGREKEREGKRERGRGEEHLEGESGRRERGGGERQRGERPSEGE